MSPPPPTSKAPRTLRDIALALTVGTIVGTYSSIFVAGPLLILFRLRPEGADDMGKPAVPAGAQPTKS